MNQARVTAQGAARSISDFVQDVRDFVEDEPLLLVVLIVLAIVVFRVTQPRVH